MNQEDHNKTEKNLITLLNWYRLKRVNEFAAQCDEAQAWESIQQRIRHRKRIRMYTYWSSTAAACLLIAAFSFYTLTEYDQSLFAHRGEQKATLFVNNGESYDLLSQDKSIFNANGMQVAQNTEKELRYDTQTSIQKNAEKHILNVPRAYTPMPKAVLLIPFLLPVIKEKSTSQEKLSLKLPKIRSILSLYIPRTV